MKSDYTTNSRYITHTIAFWKVGRIHFLSSGVKGLTNKLASSMLHSELKHAVSVTRARKKCLGRNASWGRAFISTSQPNPSFMTWLCLSLLEGYTWEKGEGKRGSARSTIHRACLKQKPCLLSMPTELEMPKTEKTILQWSRGLVMH